jgi:hypothetical protein
VKIFGMITAYRTYSHMRLIILMTPIP